MTYPTHPAAEVFPLLEGKDLERLAEDIRENGLLESIGLVDGQILDGRNRSRACELAGVEPTYVRIQLNGLSPIAYVVSKNLHRRHLTKSQRAAIATEALPMLKAEAQKRKREAGHVHGRGTTASDSSESAGQIGSGESAGTYSKKQEASEAAGEIFDVGSNYVKAAGRIKESDEGTFEDLKSGAISIRGAERRLGLQSSRGQERKEGLSRKPTTRRRRMNRCAWCNKEFHQKQPQGRFDSRECAAQARHSPFPNQATQVMASAVEKVEAIVDAFDRIDMSMASDADLDRLRQAYRDGSRQITRLRKARDEEEDDASQGIAALA